MHGLVNSRVWFGAQNLPFRKCFLQLFHNRNSAGNSPDKGFTMTRFSVSRQQQILSNYTLLVAKSRDYSFNVSRRCLKQLSEDAQTVWSSRLFQMLMILSVKKCWRTSVLKRRLSLSFELIWRILCLVMGRSCLSVRNFMIQYFISVLYMPSCIFFFFHSICAVIL